MKKEVLNVEKFIKQRIEENELLFSKKEIKHIKQEFNIIKKIYLLGFINSKDCYKIENNISNKKIKK